MVRFAATEVDMVSKLWKLLLIPFLGVFMYWQNDYNLILERIEVVSYDKHYFDLVKIHNFKYNRTSFGVNFTFHIRRDFGTNLKIQVQAYKFLSNEYRLFPLRFMFDVCDTVAKNGLGVQNMYACGNLTRCPFKKGHFIACNWAPDYSRFPPYIPGGRYLSEITLIYGSKEIAVFAPYVEIIPKNPWEMKK